MRGDSFTHNDQLTDGEVLRNCALHSLLGLMIFAVGCSGEPTPPAPLRVYARQISTTQSNAEAIGALASRPVADWPRMFGPTSDSCSPEAWIETRWPETGPPLQWKREIGLGYSGLVISQGRPVLLLRINERELKCLSLRQEGASALETETAGAGILSNE
jgi:hypothetical protein